MASIIELLATMNAEGRYAETVAKSADAIARSELTLDQRRAAILERIVALLLLRRVDRALDAMREQSAQGGPAVAELLQQLFRRLQVLGGLGPAHQPLRRAILRFGPEAGRRYVGKTLDDAKPIALGSVPRMLEAARSGRAPTELRMLTVPRNLQSDVPGRRDDFILFLPRATLAGPDTPIVFGGPTPMSTNGYWVDKFLQGVPPKGIREYVLLLQAAAVDHQALHAVDDAVFFASCGGRANYGHAIYQCLPSLRWYTALALECPIVFPKWPANIAGVMGEAIAVVLSSLGIPQSRIADPDQIRGKAYALGVIPSCGDFSVPTVSFYRDTVMPWIRRAEGSAERRARPFVYISRRLARAHPLANEDEVVALMRRLSFEIAELENLPFVDQARLLQGARVIVGAHGSGFNNLFFARAGAKVVEIRTIQREDFVQLSAAANLRYSAVQARRIAPNATGAFVLDSLDELETLCRRALEDDAGVEGRS